VTRSTVPFLLAGEPRRTDLDARFLDSPAATTAARFWAGKVCGSQAKDACVEAPGGAAIREDVEGRRARSRLLERADTARRQGEVAEVRSA